MTIFEEKIVNKLVEHGVLTSEQTKELSSIDEKSATLEEYLVRKLKIKDEDLLKAKSEIAEVPSFVYDASKPVSKEVLKLIPSEAAEQYQMVPLEKKDTTLVVGMVDPTNIKSQQALRFILVRSDLKYSIVAITGQDFKKVFSLYKELRVEVKTALEEIERTTEEEKKSDKKEEKDEATTQLQESPVTKIVAVILKHAIEGGASDIHIEPLTGNTKVRFRVDGILYSSLLLPASIHASIVARIKILTSLRLDETRVPQDGRFGTTVNGKTIDFRVSTFPTNLGEKVVMRVLDPSSAIFEFEDLGMIGENLRRINRAIKQPFGMMLVSGPTGSGKTTTLYSALGRVNEDTVNIVSLEDPVEYHVDGISQSQIRPEIGYTFASGLRHILRQDPDIIMVGEIRDSETAGLGIQSALTGHLVFSTIHTNNAIGILPRLVVLGVEPFLISSSIVLAMAQRLVGRLCESCKFQEEAHPKVSEMIDKELADLPKEMLAEFNITKPYKLWDAKGCSKCGGKKTKGRMGIHETIEMTKEIERIILEEDANALSIFKQAKKEGMVTMKQDGIIKSLIGMTRLEDVLKTVEL
ncbi:MAG: GspE/PulE family protein [Candidatus Spechtbacterales bacterium]